MIDNVEIRFRGQIRIRYAEVLLREAHRQLELRGEGLVTATQLLDQVATIMAELAADLESAK